MRDFRDAKSMAHALRKALQAKAVDTTHSECLELIAKAFGFESWNILAAKIESAPSQASGAPVLAAARTQTAAPPTPILYCSFCGKSQHEVHALVAGPGVFICDECVELCNGVIEDKEILSVLKIDEDNVNPQYPATFQHLHAKPTDDLMSCVERSRKAAERCRVEGQLIQCILSLRDGDQPTADLAASPRFALLKGKAREDLLPLQRQVADAQKRYENVLRIASAVLEVRGA